MPTLPWLWDLPALPAGRQFVGETSPNMSGPPVVLGCVPESVLLELLQLPAGEAEIPTVPQGQKTTTSGPHPISTLTLSLTH